MPRLVSANGVSCDFTLICPSQSEIPQTDQVAVCNALVQNSLFTECYTPSAPDQPISQNISSGGYVPRNCSYVYAYVHSILEYMHTYVCVCIHAYICNVYVHTYVCCDIYPTILLYNRIHCDFYMLDDRNVSIPADDILNILRMQTTLYVNRTEYRVLTIERANNDSDVAGTNPLEGTYIECGYF